MPTITPATGRRQPALASPALRTSDAERPRRLAADRKDAPAPAQARTGSGLIASSRPATTVEPSTASILRRLPDADRRPTTPSTPAPRADAAGGSGADGGGDAGVVTAPPGVAEAADSIEKGTKSAAQALQDAMPELDDAGAERLAKLMKSAAAAKGVSVAAMVLSVGDVAMKWKEYGIGDPRTQDSIASLAGGAAGAAIGSALGGPIGAALGGMIGSWAGPKVADFVRDLAKEYGDDVKRAVGTVVDGVQAVGGAIADAYDAAKDALGDLVDGIFGDDGFLDDITPDWPF